jgi:hypothetical protein
VRKRSGLPTGARARLAMTRLARPLLLSGKRQVFHTTRLRVHQLRVEGHELRYLRRHIRIDRESKGPGLLRSYRIVVGPRASRQLFRQLSGLGRRQTPLA